jgi:preprotein translocase subunit SecE
MNAKTETEGSATFDTIKLLLALAAIVGGMVGYYRFPELALPLRVLMVLGGVAVGIAIGMATARGQALWHFIQGSRVEIRKIVWPTRQETTQITIAVFIFTLLIGLFFWGLDSLLLWLTRTVTA